MNDVRLLLVYKHTSLVSGKAYVGWAVIACDQDPHSAMMRRWADHCRDVRVGSKFAFHNAIRKYGTDAWEHIVLELHGTQESVWAAEIRLIAEHRTLVPGGYNMTLGGEGAVGRVPSAETRAKLSVAQSGSNNANYGRFGTEHPSSKPRSVEQRQTISIGRSGWNPSLATRLAMSAGQSLPVDCYTLDGVLVKRYPSSKSAATDGFKSLQVNRATRGTLVDNVYAGFVWRKAIKPRKAVEQVSLIGGEVIATFGSVKAAAGATGVNKSGIGSCVRGVARQAGGFIWRYVSQPSTTVI